MLLSEAIRLGAMLGPQSFDKFYDHKTQATCALGAAAQAVNTFLGEPLNAKERYPWCLKIISVYCPKCGGKFKCAAEVIIHLNDAHHWSRNAIADVVEALEINFSVVQESEALSKKTDAFKAVIEKLPFAIKALGWLAGFAVFILPYSGFTQLLVIFCLSGAILFLIDASCRFLRRTGARQPEGGRAPQDFSTGCEVAGAATVNLSFEGESMLLSEAIRLGAGPQCFGKVHDTKAQGMADYGRKLKELYPWLFASAYAHCPDCGRNGQNPIQIFIHLNDYHCWSREAIADLVEALEAKLGIQDSEALSKQTDTQLLDKEVAGARPDEKVPARLATVLEFPENVA